MAERYTSAATLTITLEPLTPDLSDVLEEPSEAASNIVYTLTRRVPFEDFTDLNALFIESRPDMTPDHPTYAAQQIASSGNGVERWKEIQARAREHPDRYFALDTLISNKVGGYVVGEASPGEEFTWCTGIAVTESHRNLGIGGFLLDQFIHWGQHRGRPMRARIAQSNQASLSLFQSRHFSIVSTEAPTPERPVPFNIVELPLPQVRRK